MKAMICLLAAGLFILPAWGSAETKDIHAAISAAEGTGNEDAPTAGAERESVRDAEMDDLGDVPPDAQSTDRTPPAHVGAEEQDAAQEESAPLTGGHGIGTAPTELANGASDDAAAYGERTAIAPVTLAGGDWIFIDGDERRGWFFDRAMMTRNEDGSISYWQLILYNDFGRAQFVRAMNDEAYETLCYTLQRRVLSLRENTIRTYEIIAYDGANAIIADSSRDGHPTEIHPNTMAEKERDAVKKTAKKLKIRK